MITILIVLFSYLIGVFFYNLYNMRKIYKEIKKKFNKGGKNG